MKNVKIPSDRSEEQKENERCILKILKQADRIKNEIGEEFEVHDIPKSTKKCFTLSKEEKEASTSKREAEKLIKRSNFLYVIKKRRIICIRKLCFWYCAYKIRFCFY